MLNWPSGEGSGAQLPIGLLLRATSQKLHQDTYRRKTPLWPPLLSSVITLPSALAPPVLMLPYDLWLTVPTSRSPSFKFPQGWVTPRLRGKFLLPRPYLREVFPVFYPPALMSATTPFIFLWALIWNDLVRAFPRAAKTNYTNLVTVLEARSPRSGWQQDCALWGAPRNPSCLFPSFGWPQTFPALWLYVSAFVFMWPSRLCLCVLSFSYKDTRVPGWLSQVATFRSSGHDPKILKIQSQVGLLCSVGSLLGLGPSLSPGWLSCQDP